MNIRKLSRRKKRIMSLNRHRLNIPATTINQHQHPSNQHPSNQPDPIQIQIGYSILMMEMQSAYRNWMLNYPANPKSIGQKPKKTWSRQSLQGISPNKHAQPKRKSCNICRNFHIARECIEWLS